VKVIYIIIAVIAFCLFIVVNFKIKRVVLEVLYTQVEILNAYYTEDKESRKDRITNSINLINETITLINKASFLSHYSNIDLYNATTKLVHAKIIEITDNKVDSYV